MSRLVGVSLFARRWPSYRNRISLAWTAFFVAYASMILSIFVCVFTWATLPCQGTMASASDPGRESLYAAP